jgi:hypothetical protein
MYKCGCSSCWTSKTCGANAVTYCRFLEPLAPDCPADAATICTQGNNYPATCRDESCLCQKDFYAYNAAFLCTREQYVGNDWYAPTVPELFDCKPCPRGHFCTGGVETRDVLLTLGQPVVRVVVGHAPPRMCPFEGMVAKKYVPRFADPCIDPTTNTPVVNCDYQTELRSLCLSRPDACPCECPLDSQSILLPDASAHGGMSCGCSPGMYWDNSNWLLLIAAWKNATTAITGSASADDVWDKIPNPNFFCRQCKYDAFCPGV